MKRRVGRWLWRLSLGYFIVLVSAYLLQIYIGESTWWTMALAYAAQIVYLVPLLPLLVWSAVRRRPRRALLVNGVSLMFVLFVMMGLRIHFGSASNAGLTVLSFNIAHCAHSDPDQIARLIAEMDPDIICFQESTAWEGSALDRLLDEYSRYPYHDEHNDLLIATKIPIVFVATHRVGAGKLAQETQIEYRGRRLRVINVHLTPLHASDAFGTDPAGIAAHLARKGAVKAEQFRKLEELVRSWSDPTIVTGDFNAPASSRAFREAMASLDDSFASAGTGFGYTMPSRMPLTRKDYIFCGNGLDAVEHRVPATTVSDHRPVLARVILREGT